MKQEEISKTLAARFDELITWIEAHPDKEFEVSKRAEKWTTGQHIDHLIKSIAPLNQALKLPKLVLKTSFGTCNREELSMMGLKNKYKKKLAEGGVASGRYLPKSISNDQKRELVARLDKEQKKLLKEVPKWKEEALSKYVLPHPLLGKLTIREMLCFTAIHTEHHLDALKAFH